MKLKLSMLFSGLGLLMVTTCTPKKMNIQIILGSTRHGRSSHTIGTMLKSSVEGRGDVTAEIIDLRDYPLPFLYEEVVPANRKSIADPAIKKWSEAISRADAFIIVTPVYNAGYPGVLKNALDTLYKEWNNKPVAFVGYSGGPTGGSKIIEQLKDVALELKMIPVKATMTIPTVWKSFDQNGNLSYKNNNQDVSYIVDQLVAAKK